MENMPAEMQETLRLMERKVSALLPPGYSVEFDRTPLLERQGGQDGP